MSDHSEHTSDEHNNDGTGYEVHAHISSLKFYIGIFLALITFTLLTVGVSYIHLGAANLAVAIVIASMKAALVVLFFMHLKYDNKFNGLIFISSLMFIGVFFAYTINDTGHRGQVDEAQGNMIDPATGKDAPGGYVPNVMPSGHHSEAAGAEHPKTTPVGGEHSMPAGSGEHHDEHPVEHH